MDKEQLVSTVTAAQKGDNDALNTLFNEYYNDLYYFALKTVKDEETALDVTQEAFVEIINTLSNLKEPAAFVTWAKQITYHQCTRYFKKKKDVLVSEDEDGNTVFDTLQEDNAEFIPDEALDQSDFKKTVMGILDELSEEQRSATMMYYFDEMSVKQIAEIQGVSEGTVKSRLNYARKAIKNSVEEYEKKNGIKLHAIPFFPFFKWLFEGSFEGGMPLASAEMVAESVATATGTTVTVATATTTATAVTTTTATAVGIGAKIAALPLVTKIVACIVAGVIAIGGGTTAIILSQKDNNTPTSANSQTDNSYRVEYMSLWNYEQALDYYHGWLNDFNMPYFNSVNELSVDVAVRFGFSEWAGTYQGELETDSLVGEQKVLLKAIFGRDFDFTKLTGEYATYSAEKGIVTVNKDTTDIYNADSFRSDTSKPIDNGDGTYSIIIRDYRNKVNTLPNDIKDNEYVIDEDNSGYFILTHSGRLTIEKKDGFWVLKSYTKTDLQSNNSSSTDTTTSDGSSSNSNSSNDTSSSGNSANSGNPSNTSSGNNTSNSSDTEPDGIIYYDINRKTQSNLTKETVKRNLENLKSTLQPAKTKEINGEEIAYYRVDDLVAAFSQFDILGYNFTKEELLQAGGLYNRNGFFEDRIDEDNETYVTFPTNYSHTIYSKTKEDAFNLLKSDIATFFEYMGDSHDIRITHFGYPYDGTPTVELYNATVEDYTDEMIKEIAFDSKPILNLSRLSDDCSNKNDFCGGFNFTCYEDSDGGVEYVFSMSF